MSEKVEKPPELDEADEAILDRVWGTHSKADFALNKTQARVPAGSPHGGEFAKTVTVTHEAGSAAFKKGALPKDVEKYLPKVESGGHTVLPPTGDFIDLKKHEKWSKSLTPTQVEAYEHWKDSPSLIRAAVDGRIDQKKLDSFFTPEDKARVKSEATAVLETLSKQPPAPGVYYRGIQGYHAEEMAKQAKEALEKGTPYMADAAPHGVTPNPIVAHSFSMGRTLLRIVSKSARPIWKVDGLSGESHDSEKELIVPPTHYRVKAVHENVTISDGHAMKFQHVKHLIDLEEV